MLFDWANQPFQTLIVTFVFAPYFVAEVDRRPGPRPGALGRRRRHRRRRPSRSSRPLLGAIADRTGARKRWVARLLGALRRSAAPASGWRRPDMADPALGARRLRRSPSSARSSARSSPTPCCPASAPRARDRPHLRLRLGARLPRRARLARRSSCSSSRPRPAATPTLARHPADPRPRRRRRRAGARHRPALGALVPGLRAAALPLHPRRAGRRRAAGALARRPRRSRRHLPRSPRATAASSPSSSPR